MLEEKVGAVPVVATCGAAGAVGIEVPGPFRSQGLGGEAIGCDDVTVTSLIQSFTVGQLRHLSRLSWQVLPIQSNYPRGLGVSDMRPNRSLWNYLKGLEMPIRLALTCGRGEGSKPI